MLATAKGFARRYLPGPYGAARAGYSRVYRWLERRRLSRNGVDEVFRDIFKKNRWGDPESVSGTGSNLAQTRRIREWLPSLLRDLGAKSMLDIPCGDFHWMSKVDLPLDRYVGGDVVPEIIEGNRARFPQRAGDFQVINLLADPLPDVDVVFCRDCLVHFSYADIAKALGNVKRSGAKYLVTTTFPDRPANEDILTGQWRALNLQAAPINLPPPLHLLNEECTLHDNAYRDKSMGVWKVSDLPG